MGLLLDDTSCLCGNARGFGGNGGWLFASISQITFQCLLVSFALLLLSLHASWWGSFRSCAAVITVIVFASPGIMISSCISKKTPWSSIAAHHHWVAPCSCSLPAFPVLPMKSPFLMSKQVTRLLLVLNFRFFSVRKCSCCSRKWWYKTPPLVIKILTKPTCSHPCLWGRCLSPSFLLLKTR